MPPKESAASRADISTAQNDALFTQQFENYMKHCVEPTIHIQLTDDERKHVRMVLSADPAIQALSTALLANTHHLDADQQRTFATALGDALRLVKPVLVYNKERQDAVCAAAMAALEGVQAGSPLSDAEATECVLQSCRAWMSDIGDLKRLEGELDFTFWTKARRYFAENLNAEKRSDYLVDKLKSMMRDVRSSVTEDWQVRWEESLGEDLLRCAHTPTAAKICANKCAKNLHPVLDRVFKDILVIYDECASPFDDRFVAPTGGELADVINNPNVQNLIHGLRKNRVGIIAGESGSGKTMTAALVAVGDDKGLVTFARAEAVFKKEYDDEAFQRRKNTPDLENVDRNMAAKESTVGSILKCLGLTRESRLKKSSGRLTIVIDEVGGYTQMVRGLCAVRIALAAELKEILGVDAVQFICAGTGVDAPNPEWSSIPESFSQFNMQPFLWPHVNRALFSSAKHSVMLKRILGLIAESRRVDLGWLRLLLENARFAALFAKRLVEVVTPEYDRSPSRDAKRSTSNPLANCAASDEVLAGCLHFLALQALQKFFDLSGLSRSPEPEKEIRNALRLMIDRLYPESEKPDVLRTLCALYGIGTCGLLARELNVPANTATKQAIVKAPLRVSPAYCAMFLLLLNGASPRVLTPLGLALAIADYAAMCASIGNSALSSAAAVAKRERGVPHLRRIIDGLVQDKAPAGGLSAEDCPLAEVRVAKGQIDFRTVTKGPPASESPPHHRPLVSPCIALEDLASVLGDALSSYAPSSGVPRVLLNGPSASYADVLLFSLLKLVLLQCNSMNRDLNPIEGVVEEGTIQGLSKSTVDSEMRKMVPLKGVSTQGVPEYSPNRCRGGLDECMRRQRTTEALIEQAAGVQFETCESGDVRRAAVTNADKGKGKVDFTVDAVVVYEGAARPEMTLGDEDGQIEHPDVGGTELLVEYTIAYDGTAFVVRYRYFVLDVTWRREGGRTGPLHHDEPLPPLYPVSQVEFPW